jgi:SAM-dependent methyltransferase
MHGMPVQASKSRPTVVAMSGHSSSERERSHSYVAAYWSEQSDTSPLTAFRDALEKLGKNLNQITIDDRDFLSPLDEFHCLGVAATRDMARLIGLSSDAKVLDLGCGLGGPARRLATDYGCRVTGVDITKEFLDIAETLNIRMRLSSQIVLRHLDATALRLDGERFDVAWMQVTAANVAERDQLYQQACAALRHGGQFAIFDIFSENESLIKYPVPWGVDASTSALISVADTIVGLQNAGFRVTHLQDVSGRACQWFADEMEFSSAAEPQPRLDFSVLLQNWPVIAKNQVENLREGAVRFGYVVAEKV